MVLSRESFRHCLQFPLTVVEVSDVSDVDLDLTTAT